MSKHDATLHTANASPATAALQPLDGGDALDFRPARPRARHDGWSGERQRIFIETLADTGIVERAADAAGMSVQSAYALRRRSDAQAFVLAWEAALHLARQRLIDTAWTRALEGVEEIVYQDGYPSGVRKKFNDRLLMFLISRGDMGTRLSRESLTHITAEFDQFLDAMAQDADSYPEPVPPEEAEAEEMEIAPDEEDEQVEYSTSATAIFLENRCVAGTEARRLGRLYDGKIPPEPPLYEGCEPDLDISDLDPAEMERWTLEQWDRAWRSGLTSRMPQLNGGEQ